MLLEGSRIKLTEGPAAWVETPGAAPRLDVVLELRAGGEAFIAQMGLVIRHKDGSVWSTTVNRDQLIALANSDTIVRIRRDHTVGLSAAYLAPAVESWLTEGSPSGCVVPEAGRLEITIHIDRALSSEEHDAIARLGIEGDDQSTPSHFATTRALDRDQAVGIVKLFPEATLLVDSCEQLNGTDEHHAAT